MKIIGIGVRSILRCVRLPAILVLALSVTPFPLFSAEPQKEDTAESETSGPETQSTPIAMTADELAWMIAHPETWPKEVEIIQPVQIDVSRASKKEVLDVKVGTKAKVLSLGSDDVEVLLGKVTTRLPFALTDLSLRASQAKQSFDEQRVLIEKDNGVLDAELLTGEQARSARAAEVAKQEVVFAKGAIRPKFVHPGIPLTREDLDQVKTNLDKEPWKSGYVALMADGHSQLDYKMRGPFEMVSRNPHINRNQWMSDMQAVWNLSRMWYFTKNEAYAQKAHDILIAWAKTQKSFVGIESNLDLGDYAYRFAGGADILRGTWPGWTQTDTRLVQDLFGKVYWPASGASVYGLGPANKGTLALAAGAAIAIFNDDQEKFDHVLYMLRTSSSCAFPNTFSNGEIGETARDQGHAYGQWVSMAFISEVFWKQGVDVYSELDNRMLAIGEYYGRYNLGVKTPFIPTGTTDAYHLENTSPPWPHGLMGLNILQGAYVLRKGMEAPYLDMRRRDLKTDLDSFVFQKSADSSTAVRPAPFSFPPAVSVTTGLIDLDVGGGPVNGGSAYADGVWTLCGGGNEIWTHDKDSFHFSYLQVRGDCTIIAKVNAVGSTAPNARAGVMIRQSLTDSKVKAWVAITPAPNYEFFLSGWTQIRGGPNWEKRSRPISQIPYWVKLQRLGNVISVFVSPDGSSWGTGGEACFENLEQNMFLGLMVCSQKGDTLNTSTFSDVRITGGAGGGPVKIPAAPLAIYASPGFKRVPLRWAEAAGATTYTVKRSAQSGGPYETVATVKESSYIDEGLTNQKPYFYVVSAVNAAGESPNSPEDKVIPGGRLTGEESK